MKHTLSHVKLANGAQGLLIHIPDASVMTFDMSFRAGEYLIDDERKWEVPHLMEHVVLGANELIPKARDFQAELEKNGAYSNASTGVYDITYEMECADFEWERAYGLLLIAITKPLFLEDEFTAEFGNVQEEMAARANSHSRQLSLEMRRAVGLTVRTDTERLKLMENVQVQDLRAHYKRTHTTPNLRFIIAGNIVEERQRTIEQLLEAIELPTSGERFVLPAEIPSQLERPVYIENTTVENLYFYIDTFACHRLTQAETDALHLLNTMLTETLYSRIFGTARERGLVYGMSSGLSYTRDATNWWLGGQVSDKNAAALLEIIVKELQAVMAGDISDDEIQSTKQYSLGRFQRGAQTVGGTANGYVGRYFFDDVIEPYLEIPERIQAVTKGRIVEAARTMFADQLWSFGILGNCGEAFAADLRTQLAPLWEADGRE